MELKQVTHIDNVRLSDDGRAVRILDQSLLPNETIYLELQTPEELYEAIATLRVRGAPAIGIFAGYALYVLALQTKATSYADFLAECQKNRDYLNSSRPTAVNLRHMLDRVLAVVRSMPCADIPAIQAAMGQMAKAIHEEDIAMCTAISEYGLPLVKAGDGSLTLIFDNMASLVMKQGKINACFVGCDRVARNGDTANKIGTSGVAILAKHYGIPFYVLGPSSTIDFTCPDGDHIPIELRDGAEIKEKFFSKPSSLPEVKCYNPAFDVTDHSLIAGIVTEKGVCRAPYTQSLAALFDNKT